MSDLPALYLSRHALTRYAEHYPEATDEDVLAAALAAEEIGQSIGNLLRGKAYISKSDDTVYRLHRERTGLFVVRDTTVVTFLRFEITQHRQAVRLFGAGDPVAESVPWAWLVRPELAGPFDDQPEPEPASAQRDNVLGIPLDELHLSAKARKIFGGREALLDALARGNLVHPAETDAEHTAGAYEARFLEASYLLRAPGGGWVGVYLDVDEVRVLVPTVSPRAATAAGATPEPVPSPAPAGLTYRQRAKKIDREQVLPISGLPLADLRVSRTVIYAFVGETVCAYQYPGALWLVRNAAMQAEVIEDLEAGFRVRLQGLSGPLEAWLMPRAPVTPDEPPEWWLLHTPRFEPIDDHLILGRLLRRAGWTVFPPVWVDELQEAAP